MKHIAGSLAVLAIALSFSYADSGDARIMKFLHQKAATGVVAECQALHTTTRESVKSLETAIRTNVKDFRKLHPEGLAFYIDVSTDANMKAFVAAKKSLRENEKNLRVSFADSYSEKKDTKLKDEYATKLIALEQSFYDSLLPLVKTNKKDAYKIFVKDAMAMVTKNKPMRLEIVMKRVNLMLKCGQGRHDKVIELIGKVMSSDMSAQQKQKFLDRITKRMQEMKKKIQKIDKRHDGAAFEGTKDDKREMIDDVLESVERALSELEDENSRE